MSETIDKELKNKMKVFVLTEEYEDKDGIRSFRNCLITFDKSEALNMLNDFKDKDEYGYISHEGILIERDDYLCTKFNSNGYVEYKIEESEIDFILLEQLREGIITMMKYMVSNSWHEAIDRELSHLWLSTGTGWSKDFIKELSRNEALYREDYIDGGLGCPFHEDFEKIQKHAKNKKKELERF